MRLFERVKIGNVTLPNRVALAPMGQKTAPDGAYDSRSIEYFRRRAAGGCGLIITGLNMVTTEFETRAANVLEGFHQTDRLGLLIDKCHQHGAKVLIQIGPGLGRVGYADPEHAPYSASAVPTRNFPDLMCKPFSVEQIKILVKRMGRGAMLAKKAGADGVEIHAYGGYIIDQFLTSAWNKRTDEYGGSLENRTRILMEMLEEVKKVCGPDFLCVAKVTVDHCLPEVEGMRGLEEGLEIVKMLDKAGVDAIHVDTGCYEKYYYQVDTVYEPKGFQLATAQKVKEVVHVPIIVHGKLNDPMVAEKAIVDGCADIVALGHQMLADEEWANKVKAGDWDNITYCVGCNECLYAAYRGKFRVCAMNPISGNEVDYPSESAEGLKRMLVVGGGPGGIEAAVTAAAKGMEVELWEKTNVLGGNLRSAAAPSFKNDVKMGLASLIYKLNKSNIKVIYNKEAQADEIIKGNWDYVVLATGARPIMPPIKGIDGANVLTASEMLVGAQLKGKVVVIGAGLVGCEAALHAAQTAQTVTIVEALDKILLTADHLYNCDQSLRAMLAASPIKIITSAKVCSICDKKITYEKDGQFFDIEANTVVIAVGYKSNNELEDQLWGKVNDVRLIGDAMKPRKIVDAVGEGFHYSRLAK